MSTADRAREFRHIEMAARAMADKARELVDPPIAELAEQIAARAAEVAALDEIPPGAASSREDEITRELPIPLPEKEPPR